MKTKLFGLVMAFCLLAGAFAGMTVLADETIPLYGAETWSGSTSSADGVYTVTNSAVMYKATANAYVVDPYSVYQFTLDYVADADGAYLYVERLSPEKPNGIILSKVSLPKENSAVSVTFVPGVDAMGNPATNGFRFRVVAPASGNLKAAGKDAATLKKLSAKPEDFMPSEEGTEVKFITGGEQITGGARVGEKMMKVTQNSPMTIDFTTSLYDLVKFRGFMKAVDMADGDTVKVTFYQGAVANNANNVKIAEKTYTVSETDTNLKDLQNGVWEYFRFSGMPGPQEINVKFEVTSANGYVLVDGVTIEEDKNIARDPRFAFALANDPNYVKWASFDGSIATDGDCPDGQNYMVINSGSVESSGHGTNDNLDGRVALSGNARYLLSFWYKSESDFQAILYASYSGSHNYTNPDGTEFAGFKDSNKNMPWRGFIKANSEWSRVSILLTSPSNITVAKLAMVGATNLKISDWSLEKINEEEIRFFVPDLTGCLQAEPMSKDQIVFMTYLGREVEVSEDVKAGESVKATCLVPVLDGNIQKLSEDRVIIATYEMVDGEEKLTNIKVGSAAARGPSDVAGVTYGSEYLGISGVAMAHMNYPGARLEAAEAKTNVRAFCWNSLDGLKAITDMATIR